MNEAVFLKGWRQLPPQLYPHGTAVMNTVQQVTGSIATAVSISILSTGMEHYLQTSAAPKQPNELANAMTMGSQHVFWLAAIVAVSVLSFHCSSGVSSWVRLQG
ncbi:hypothetical protein ACLBWT_15655 [Paenibacillus sp. D51F]